MRARRSAWSAACLAAGLALSLAAVGCGDDDDGDDTPAGGTGGAKAGTGGANAGTGGTGGNKAGTGGGGAIDPAKCVTDTTALMMGSPGALSSKCISCLCQKGASAANMCNNVAGGACWQFLACYADKGCTPANQSTCVFEKCATEYGKPGVGPAANAIGPVIQTMCPAECADDGGDAGTNDAGN